MFKDLKNGFQVCLLDKSQKTPVYKIGNVVSVSAPRLDSRPMPPGQIPSPMMYSERVIDLTVECDGQTNTYVVQENANVASIASLTLACSVEPILNEVRAIHKTSTDIIASVDRHKEVVAKCEDILEGAESGIRRFQSPEPTHRQDRGGNLRRGGFRAPDSAIPSSHQR